MNSFQIWFQNFEEFVEEPCVSISETTHISKHDWLLKELGPELIMASDRGNIETVEFLISNSADINAISNYRTALINASKSENTKTVEKLIAIGTK